MELLIGLAAFVALDVLALEVGFGRGRTALDHHDRALDAVRRGEMDVYRWELAAMEREARRSGAWRV